MNKIGQVIVVTLIVGAAMLFLLVTMPVVTEMANTANTTMSATSNMSHFPGTAEFMVSVPWLLFFVPPTIGMIVVVIILKRP